MKKRKSTLSENSFIFKFQVDTLVFGILFSIVLWRVCLIFQNRKRREGEMERVLMTKYKASRYMVYQLLPAKGGRQVFNGTAFWE